MIDLFSPAELTRYSRNILLPQVGLEGQQRLKTSSVLIVGLGGLGSPVALYLAAAGVGRLGLADPDQLELSNLQRQVLHATTTIGQPKSTSAKARLQDLNPEIQLDVIPEAVMAENAMDILENYTVIVDATDNLISRYLLNDACYLSHKPLVHGSVYHFEGQVCVFDGRRDACYRCVFPYPPPSEQVTSSPEIGVLGVLPGLIGTIQATETLKLILGLESALMGSLLLYDAIQMSFQKDRLHKNPDCPLCGEHPTITNLIGSEYEKIGKLKE
jgi:sulfur-carrier protein adenylyltransferase/sulfurtransferase